MALVWLIGFVSQTGSKLRTFKSVTRTISTQSAETINEALMREGGIRNKSVKEHRKEGGNKKRKNENIRRSFGMECVDDWTA